MNALLLYPEWPDTYWSFRHALPFQGKLSSYPPLWLHDSCPAACQLGEALIHMNVRALTDSDLAWPIATL